MHRDVSQLRNIGILASVDAGYVTCRERILGLIGGGRTNEAPSRSPASSSTWMPSSGPFAGETMALTIIDHAPRALDGAVVVLDGARGTAETAEALLRDMCARRVPCVVFIDDVGGQESLDAMVDSLEVDLGMTTVPVHLPWSDERGTHVIDVLEQRLVIERGNGVERELRPVPAQAEETAFRVRRRIVDICAEFDDAIYGASAAGLEVGADELARALRKAMLGRVPRVLVVTCGSLRARRGMGLLLDALVTYLPSPAERPPIFGVDPRRSVTVARFAREADAFAATVFATTNVPAVGQLTWLRVYSGTIDTGRAVVRLPRDERGRIDRIFLPDVRGLVEIDTAGPGAIVCVSSVLDANPGETLACVRAPIVLDGSRPAMRAAEDARPARLAVDGR